MIQLLISDSDGRIGVVLMDDSNTSHHIPLTTGSIERILTNLCLHINSGIAYHRIVEHATYHQSTTIIDSHCPCCKLEGRILAAQGRRASSEADRLIASRAHTGGKVEVRRIKPGISGAQLRAYEEAYAKRTTPHSNVVKSVNKRIEDLI